MAEAHPIRSFSKVLCANRGEIAIRAFRACSELGIRTVGVFSEQDRTSQHRYKADEAYLVGRGRSPIAAYLATGEILDIAERAGAEAIHPGYGFHSENADFAAACAERGIVFIGPSPATLNVLGNKISAREVAATANVPTIPGLTLDIAGGDAAMLEAARAFAREHAPVIVKAAFGGGGRGMRVVPSENEIPESIEAASREAEAAFGRGTVFIEKYLPSVRHVEVQVLGDLHGNLVHLHERDCSVQRRHQKVIEVAPAMNLDPAVASALHADALKIASACDYHNAGTVEFLVAEDGRHYFIEVNPRLQVEHTVTEMVTGIDLVQAQIRIAEGYALDSEEIGILAQEHLNPRGFSIQCRVTTEDPGNNFLPDTGTILAYRSASGFGIRLDDAQGYTGATISPHYDSLLVKMTTFGPTLERAATKGLRALKEFRIRGVKTNLQFLESVLGHPTFLSGGADTQFIDDTPELFHFPPRRDRATKLLRYLAEVIVNGHPTIPADKRERPTSFAEPTLPQIPGGPPPSGTVQILAERGAEGLAQWISEQNRPLITDTTMRDAHQSLLATRVRTHDLVRIAPATAMLAHDLFSLETWGGATFDVAYRFLNENPWTRLERLKAAIPNVLQQMLLRGSNAVGYTSYPDNVVEAFVDEAAHTGIDVFRIFDSLNDLANMRIAIDRVIRTGKVAEVSICYTGDVANPKRVKYDLDYYIELAKRIEGMGAHILCVKDMAGLLRPQAARALVNALKQAVKLPIHLHTHDTSGNGVASLLEAIACGVDIVDVALAPMAGMTSQPSWNALVAALRGESRETGMANKRLQPLANYWETLREVYRPFECGLKSSTSEVYFHEIPGGQYSNLRPQVAALGLLHRWDDVKYAFAVVNQLVGDIPKVTPSSKMVGDFATFLVQNDLLEIRDESIEASTAATQAKLLESIDRLDLPQSVVTYFQGHLGHPPGGFPPTLREAVLRGVAGEVEAGRPSERLPPLDIDALRDELQASHANPIPRRQAISAALYPRVLRDHLDFYDRHADVSILDSPTYFYGMEPEQEIWVDLEPGKTLVIRLDSVSDPFENGTRTVYFDLNGQGRYVTIVDRTISSGETARRRADPLDPTHIGASMPGNVISVDVAQGDEVEAGQPLLALEAMKMETIVRAPHAGTVVELLATANTTVEADDLLARIE